MNEEEKGFNTLRESFKLLEKSKRYLIYNKINIIIGWILIVCLVFTVTNFYYWRIILGLFLINFAWRRKILYDLIKMREYAEKMLSEQEKKNDSSLKSN